MRQKLLILFTLLFSYSLLFAQQNENINVISFNIRLSAGADGKNVWKKRKSATLQMVRQEQPSLLCLQEALPDQMKFLDQKLSAYRHIGVGRDDGKSQGEHMAIFYLADEFELLEHGDFWLSETPNQVSMGWDAACHRIVTWGYFRSIKTGAKFYCFNTHLDHVGEKARENSIILIQRKLNEIVKDKKAAVILTGDFNSTTDNAIFNPLKKNMSEARKTAAVTDHKGTFNGFGSAPNSIILDHIFISNCKALVFKTLTKNYGKPYISDHYPVQALLEIK